MLKTLILTAALMTGLVSDALAEGDDNDPGSDVLQPVIDDEPVITPGNPDDLVLEPVIEDEAEITPGTPDDVVLEPVLDPPLGPPSDRASDGPSEAPKSRKPDRVRDSYTVYLTLRPDGSPPEVALRRAANGRDSEIWIDGTKRVIFRNGAALTLGNLTFVYS